MKLRTTFLSFDEREYTSKKTGAQAVAREVQVLTENKQLLVFGYGNFAKDTDYESLKAIPAGSDVILDVTVTGNKYNRNSPTVILNGIVG